ncbi:unnamed protein product, partial [Rotaria socialis]
NTQQYQYPPIPIPTNTNTYQYQYLPIPIPPIPNGIGIDSIDLQVDIPPNMNHLSHNHKEYLEKLSNQQIPTYDQTENWKSQTSGSIQIKTLTNKILFLFISEVCECKIMSGTQIVNNFNGLADGTQFIRYRNSDYFVGLAYTKVSCNEYDYFYRPHVILLSTILEQCHLVYVSEPILLDDIPTLDSFSRLHDKNTSNFCYGTIPNETTAFDYYAATLRSYIQNDEANFGIIDRYLIDYESDSRHSGQDTSMMIDAGGYHGIYALYGAALNQSVHIFEVLPKYWIVIEESLRKNVHFQKMIYLHKFGVSDE